ncbi:MAG: hypothetical protein Q8L85_07710, partial [Alphaproteobacteria bacterium]|nr:hypothetical protein [Alphaproteobacteria bacterium]
RPPGRTSFLYTRLRIWSFLLSPTLLGGRKLAMTTEGTLAWSYAPSKDKNAPLPKIRFGHSF